MNHKKSELKKITDSVSKTIVDNFNNVLGLFPSAVNLEVHAPRAKKRKHVVHHRKPKRTVTKVKSNVVQLKKAAKRKVKAVKAKNRRAKPRARTAKAA